MEEPLACTVENGVMIEAIDYMKWDYAGCHFFVAWRFSLDDWCFSSCITIMISSAKHCLPESNCLYHIYPEWQLVCGLLSGEQYICKPLQYRRQHISFLQQICVQSSVIWFEEKLWKRTSFSDLPIRSWKYFIAGNLSHAFVQTMLIAAFFWLYMFHIEASNDPIPPLAPQTWVVIGRWLVLVSPLQYASSSVANTRHVGHS